MAKIKFVLPLMLCMFFTEIISACEFHNFFSGTNPLYTRNVFGFRYRMRDVVFKHDEAMEALSGEHHHAGGTLQYAECWGRFYLTKKTIAWVNIPLFLNPGENTWLGDPSVLIQQQLVSSQKENSNFSMRWFAGIGLKLPSPVQKTIDTDAQFITSTGSLDLLANSTLIMNYKKLGITADASYKLNYMNKQDFKYGNITNANLALFYRIVLQDVRIIPSASLFSELAGNNQEDDIVQANSGYKNMYAGGGIDLFMKHFTLGLSAQRIIYTSEEGLSEWRFQAGVAFSFGN